MVRIVLLPISNALALIIGPSIFGVVHSSRVLRMIPPASLLALVCLGDVDEKRSVAVLNTEGRLVAILSLR